MKNLFKSKKINAFLLTMIMLVSLFFFSACAEDEEKVLFKIVYRPYASSYCSGEFFKTYETIIQEDIEKTAENVLTRVVGGFGIGEIELEKTDKTKVTLKPETDDYYYSDLLGISISDKNYQEYVSKITQTTNVIYLSAGGDKHRILVLSNNSVTSNDVSNYLVKYDEETNEFKAQSTLREVSNNNSYGYDDVLYENSVYFYDAGSYYSFIFLGEYAYNNNSKNNFNGVYNAQNYVSMLLSTNYNNIQQTVSRVDIYDGADVNISSTKWKYSLDDNHGIFNAEEYLDAYKYKYQKVFEVELANAILTRSECTLSESLDALYQRASRETASYSDQQKFIEECCNYIDHLGLIEEEIDSLTKFILEKAMGPEISEGNEALAEYCKKILKDAQDDVGYTPLLEVLSYKGSELEEIKIEGYIQSIIILADADTYNFSGVWCIFDVEEETELLPYEVTVRHQEYGQVTEYPLSLEEQDLKEGSVLFTMDEVLENGDSVDISSCADPIKPGLLSKKTSIVDKAKEYRDKFIYSTSTKNTKALCWCFNDEDSNFIEISFGFSNLCINQSVNLGALFF